MKNKRTFIPKYKKYVEKLLEEIISDFEIGDLFYSQRDLMKNLGASYATVSHVLAELKKAGVIETHIGKGIFIKNIPAKTKKEGITISFFVDNWNCTGLLNSPIAGICQRALIRAEEKYGCKIKYHIVDSSERAAIESFKENPSDGILFFEERFMTIHDFAVSEKIPYTVVHPLYNKFDYSVDIDDVSGIKTAVSALIERGSSRILLIGSNMEKGHNRYKAEGYRQALGSHGLEIDSSLFADISSQNISELVLGIRKLLSERNDYDGLFIISPEYFAIVEENMSVAAVKKLNIAVCGNYGSCISTNLDIGTVNIPYAEAIDAGLEILLKKINNDKLPPQRILLKPDFRWKNN